MASTPLLGLSLPADGTTNWGTLVNTSITALLDSAVAGTTTLSTDADVTLTTTTEAANQARQAILLCTGARAAIRTITAPAQSKTYVVINNTTGGFGVKIVGTGPTAGVTVPSGKAYMVAWNGSDFVVTSITTVNLATDVTGTLPVANGGTGQTTQQAAINALVGTQTANRVLRSDGTNSTLSQVALPTDVTGTLAIGNGGTGQTNQQAAINALVGTQTANRVLRSDGTNSTLSQVALATDVSGTLSVANGGTGVTTSTGTGSVVLSNSPSLITPALGTPASGNFSAGTFTWPTFNQNTTGSSGSVINAVTFNNGGAGEASGTTFNGSVARTISYNTVGAPSTTGTGASGTWSININGTVGATTANAGTFTLLRTGTVTGSVSGTLFINTQVLNQASYTLTGTTIFDVPLGIPVDGQKLIIRIKDNGSAQTISWNAIWRPIGVTLPTVTVAGKITYIGCIYNNADTKWDVVAVTTQA